MDELTGARKPIFGTDFSKPLSQIMEELRSKVANVRGQCSDIGFAYSGWRDEMAMLEGGLTCMLVAMYHSLERFKEHEALIEAEKADKAASVPSTEQRDA